jgi:hypothetical protein
MKRGIVLAMGFLLLLVVCTAEDCSGDRPGSDKIQTQQQEKLLLQGTAQVGMPAIKNFRERRLLKEILELRDQEGLTTYTYLFNQYTGELVFFGVTIGYGIPYATQFTAPQKIGYSSEHGVAALPQSDPNGLFSPASAEGTWVLMKNPNGRETLPVYVEPRIVVSPFILPQAKGNPR